MSAALGKGLLCRCPAAAANHVASALHPQLRCRHKLISLAQPADFLRSPLHNSISVRSSGSKAIPASEQVAIDAARLDQLLEAEITTMSLKRGRPMTLQSILDTKRDTAELALILYDELPVRFAQRIKMLESLPGWRAKKTIATVREMYVTSFKELRLVDPENQEEFQSHLINIKKRHSHTSMLVDGFKQYAQAEEMNEADINMFLDRFFLLRISTTMLTSHYLQMVMADDEGIRQEFENDVNPYQSSINASCDPVRIARHAADVVTRLCMSRHAVAPEVVISNAGALPFPFVPRYLFYIISELLKNSIRATVELYQGHLRSTQDPHSQDQPVRMNAPKAMPPVHILVSGDENVACFRISDEAGGIPLKRMEHIWSYLYTTADAANSRLPQEGVDAPIDVRLLEPLMEPLLAGNPKSQRTTGCALSGLGCGLPLCRLYARYLGGTVELQTLPHFGTDVFVSLPAQGNLSEDLPTF